MEVFLIDEGLYKVVVEHEGDEEPLNALRGDGEALKSDVNTLLLHFKDFSSPCMRLRSAFYFNTSSLQWETFSQAFKVSCSPVMPLH